MRRIAVINQKGGVGKTTTAVNLGAALARAGKRVLLIDLDPQSHLTLHVGVDPATRPGGTYEALTQSMPLDEIRRPVEDNLWLVGSHIDLAAAEVELVSVIGREVILRDLLDAHQTSYDYVIMDCPPSLGVLTLNALAAAGEVFIPLQPHYLALHGLSKLLETVSLVAKRINASLRVTGVVVCMYEAGTRLATEVIEDVQSFLHAAEKGREPWAGAKVFRTVIRRNIKLAECPSHGKTIFDYEPKSNGAEDYAALAIEVRSMVEAGLVAPAARSKTVPAASKPVAAPVVETAPAPRKRPVAAKTEKPTAKPHAPKTKKPAPPAPVVQAKPAPAGARPARENRKEETKTTAAAPPPPPPIKAVPATAPPKPKVSDKPRAKPVATELQAPLPAAETPRIRSVPPPEKKPDPGAAAPDSETPAPGVSKEKPGHEAAVAPTPGRRPRPKALAVAPPVARFEPAEAPPEEPLSQTA